MPLTAGKGNVSAGSTRSAWLHAGRGGSISTKHPTTATAAGIIPKKKLPTGYTRRGASLGADTSFRTPRH